MCGIGDLSKSLNIAHVFTKPKPLDHACDSIYRPRYCRAGYFVALNFGSAAANFVLTLGGIASG